MYEALCISIWNIAEEFLTITQPGDRRVEIFANYLGVNIFYFDIYTMP